MFECDMFNCDAIIFLIGAVVVLIGMLLYAFFNNSTFNQGRHDYEHGAEEYDNPYERSDYNFDEWADGYQYAKDMDEIRRDEDDLQ